MTWNSTLKRTTPLRARGAISRRSQPIKSKGMKGSPVSAAQKAFHDQLAGRIGCVACRNDWLSNFTVSIHHIDGRTKANAHWLVLPLCAGHHQDGTGARGLIAVHPWKTRFEARYGKQMDLLVWCIEQLQLQGLEVPEGALRAAGMLEVA
ncbi:Ref family recombination enhancement nuclease [Achromobacter xylosoxidans]